MKKIIKRFIDILGINPFNILEKSIKKAAYEQGLHDKVEELRRIIPDISQQYSRWTIEDSYHETKTRTQQAFQMRLFERAVRMQNKKNMILVDIGDSAGTHLMYIKSLCKDISFRTISVNLDEKAVQKIAAKGMEAICCAAEELDLAEKQIDLFVTFQMVEHLMDPCLFFRKLAVKGKSDYLLVTVPYRNISSVGLWTYRPLISALKKNSEDLTVLRNKLPAEKYAEDEHIFELSPVDWKLLMLFSGWMPIYDEIYLQYPKRHYLYLTKPIWKNFDFEGFWGVILQRDRSFSDIYKDWRD